MSESEVQDLREKVAALEDQLKAKDAEINSLKSSASQINTTVFQNELFNCLMDVLPQAVFFKDSKGNYIRVNRTSVKQMGVENEDDVIGKSNYDFFDKVYADQTSNDEQTIIQTGESMVDKEELLVTNDGKEWWESTTRMPLKTSSGKIIGTFGISRLARKGAETSEHLQAFMDQMPDRIFFKDLESRFVIINKACAVEMGFNDPSEARGKTDKDIFKSENADKWIEEEKALMEKGEGKIYNEALEKRKDGREVWVSVTKIPWKEKSGKVKGIFGITHDITVAKEMEQKLMALMDNIPDKIYFKNLKNEFVLINKHCALGFGLEDPADVLGKTDFDYFDASHARPSFDDEQEIVRTGQPIIGKEELETWPDGSETWVSSTKMPWRNDNGEIIGTFGLSRDITNIKVIEEQLQSLMNTVPDRIYFKDQERRFVNLNPACASIFDVESTQDVIGKRDEDFFAPEHYKKTRDEEQNVMDTGKALIAKEELEVWADGTEKWVSTTKMPWRDPKGQIKGILGVTRDISEIKRTETELKCLMDFLPDSIFFKDREGLFTQISRSKAIKHNLESPKDAVGKSDFDFFARSRAESARQDELEIMDSGKPIIGKEEFTLDSYNNKHWTSTTKVPLRDHHNNIIGTFGLARDITKVKYAEEALQISNEKLEKKVQLRTRELRKANAAMKVHIEQLDYLNKKARFFAQLIDKDTLLSAIFFSFADQFRTGQVHIMESTDAGFKTLFNTPMLSKESLLGDCVEALKYFEPDRTQQISFVKSWPGNSLLKPIFSKRLQDLPCYIIVPLVSNRKLRGVVQIFAPKDYTSKFESDKHLLSTLAAQAAISLENAYHYEELGEKTRIESELGIAKEIQKRYTPSDPKIPFFNLKGFCQPANEVGGDYLDFFQNNNGDWVIVIADVCGKGIPAALVMTSLRSTVRVEGQNVSSSKKIMTAVNNFMADDLQRDKSFITAMCIVIDKEGNSMNYTRAGHPMLISYGESTELPETINCNGIALGMVMGDTFASLLEEIQIPIYPGDKFLAYTDGLDEAMNPEKKTYGVKRLMEVLGHSRQMSPGETVSSILDDVKVYVEGQRQYDDLTLVALERK